MAQQEIFCPHCQQALTIETDWIGMELECPACKKNFTIPAPASAPAPTPVLTPVLKMIQPAGKFMFVCPSCNGSVELPDNLRGTKYECQFCFEEHIAEPMVKEEQNPVKEEETFIFICPSCETTAELPESMLGQEYECPSCCEKSIAQVAEERKCPKCGEMIKLKATICKHCKSNITPLIPQKKINTSKNINITTPQILSPINPGMNVTTPLSAENKTWTALVLWNLLLPGLGQVYLGHTKKGVICLVLFLPVMIVVGLLTSIPGIGHFTARLVYLMAYGFIVGESFGTLTLLQMGQVLEKNQWLPLSSRNALNKTLPPEIKKKQMISIGIIVAAALLGLTGWGILGWIYIFSMNA